MDKQWTLARDGVSREVPCSALKGETVPARRIINKFRYADDTTLMAESEEELKSLLMKMKEESEKVGLQLNIQKMIPL